jgi:glycosyltransferase involved in cell wall biosynthesis
LSLRVLRVYHAGRNPAHRARERALVAAGVDVTLVVPSAWPGGEDALSAEAFEVVELDVVRPGDVNRHRYRDGRALARLVAERQPDLLDVHEEPFSAAARQWLRAAPSDLPVAMYTAQNVDKRLPPPFHQWERAAHRRVAALYPCSRQAASVARGKGFEGRIEVLPLGYDDALLQPGRQTLDAGELVLAFVGRLVPEKGVTDAVEVLACLARERPARLVVCGDGPAGGRALALAESLGVGDRLELTGTLAGEELTRIYRSAHVVLVPSRPTATWTEQFGRVIVEAQASGAVVVGYDSVTVGEVGGRAAVLAPTGDVAALGDAVLALVRDPEGFERRRRAGLELAAGRTWARMAERQAALYRETVAAPPARQPLPASPRRRRAQARAEFGPTAPTTGGTRPFALPLLRRGGALARSTAAACDLVGEVAAWLPLHRRLAS